MIVRTISNVHTASADITKKEDIKDTLTVS